MLAGEFAASALAIPYAPGRGDWVGADCWGIVELYYEHVLGISVPDRANHPAGHGGLQAGFDAAEHWAAIVEPVDHCLVIMRAHGFEAGHVGVHFAGSVLHSSDGHGCVCQPIGHRFIRTATTQYLRHQ